MSIKTGLAFKVCNTCNAQAELSLPESPPSSNWCMSKVLEKGDIRRDFCSLDCLSLWLRGDEPVKWCRVVLYIPKSRYVDPDAARLAAS